MTRPEGSVADLLVDCAGDRGGVAWLEALRAAVRLVRVTLDRPLRGDHDQELDELIASAHTVVSVATSTSAAEPRPRQGMLEAG